MSNRILAIDLRAHSINAVLATVKRDGTLYTERAAHLPKIGNDDTIGRALIDQLESEGFAPRKAHVIASVDPKSVATTTVTVQPYIEQRDYAGIAKRRGNKLPRPTRAKRRIKWVRSGKHQILMSVADEKAVDNMMSMIRAWSCIPWRAANPALVWLNTIAPHGIIDDLGTTTLFAAPGEGGTVYNDIIPHDDDPTRFATTTIQMVQTQAVQTDIKRLSYFGPAHRFTMLHARLKGMDIELVPAVPPEHAATQPWTYAHALATYGASEAE